MPWGVAAAGIASAVGGAVASGSAANSQANAAENATNAQLGMFNTVMGNLKPYQTAGAGSLNNLNSYLNTSATGGPGGQPGLLHNFSAADLNANLAPNYGFQLSQGQGALQNQYAAGGGALGGNALSGMQAFTQNYAQNAYQQAFQNYQQNQQNIYGRLGSLAQLGENAATGSASGAPQFASGISQTIQGVGAANAAGTVGTANAISGGLNNLGGYFALNNILGGGGGGGGGGLPFADISLSDVNNPSYIASGAAP